MTVPGEGAELDLTDEAHRPLDERAFASLFRQTQGTVFTFAARRLTPEQAKDVVSETFEVAWRKRCEAPDSPIYWAKWVMAIARNKVLQEAQRPHRRHHDNRFIADLPDTTDRGGLDEVADMVVDSITSRNVYAQLTPNQKELLDMVLLREVTPSQAAELLNLSVSAYTTRVNRLRKRITDLSQRARALDPDDAIGDSEAT